MKTCDYNHLLLYAKNHYERSGDVVQDVKAIVAERCLVDIKHTSDEDVWHVCSHALLEYSHQHVDQFFNELFKPLHGEEDYHVAKWFSYNCPLSRAINLVLIQLAHIAVLDDDGNKILELGDPDPAILPLRNVMTCTDNTGMEDKVDRGIDYVSEDHKDPKMIYVYDRFGEKQECFRDRFAKCDKTKKSEEQVVNG